MTELSHNSSASLSPIVAACPHAIVGVDKERRIRTWNPAAVRIFGWEETDVLGRPVPFVTAEQQQESNAFNERALAGESFSNFEVRRIRRDGTTIDLLVSAAPTYDPNGQIDGFVTVATDITEQKDLQLQLFRTQRLDSLGTLASGIAHDLNNVLAPIQMSLELIRMRLNDPSMDRTLETLDGCVKRGTSLVRQILTFARGMKGDRTAVSTVNVMRDIERVLVQTMPKSLTIEAATPADLWAISADVTQLHQVLMNLCINARDAMPDGGTLSVTTRNVMLDEAFIKMSQGLSIGPHVCFEVKDNGMGMPPEIREKIFDPFFTTKETDKGTGLGLSTVAAIVKAHSGFVHVYSEPGRGTSFKVYWPALPKQAKQETAGKPRAALPSGHGEVILIVDDEAAVRDIAGLALETHGYRVLHAQDGAEGVAVYAQNLQDIRLVISDMDMPVMNGAAMIRSLERINPNVRVLSASGLIAERHGVPPSGRYRRVLPKPYTAAELLANVKELIAEA